MRRAIAPLFAVLTVLALLGCGAAVKDKRVVQIDYTLTLPDGSVYDTSIGEGKEPLEFMVGAGQMIPSLEKELLGLRVKGKKKIVVKAADAYGEYDEKAVQEVPRSEVPQGMELTVGETYTVQTALGPMPITVKSMTDKIVVMDLNHPLAGKDLTFDIQVMKVRDATKEELAQALAQSGMTQPIPSPDEQPAAEPPAQQ
jgi:FKBP-type peptidyl-prolyl cis-trans isomerase 2